MTPLLSLTAFSKNPKTFLTLSHCLTSIEIMKYMVLCIVFPFIEVTIRDIYTSRLCHFALFTTLFVSRCRWKLSLLCSALIFWQNLKPRGCLISDRVENISVLVFLEFYFPSIIFSVHNRFPLNRK